MKSHPLQSTLALNLGVPSREIAGTGQGRALSGDAMETAIHHLFNLTPGVINSTRAVNPDAYTPDDSPVEIKSLKHGQKLIVYDWRSAKDPIDTLYFIGIHKRPPSTNVSEIWEGLAATLREVFIIPAPVIARLAALQPLRKINTTQTASGDRNGYQRAGYREGYRNVPFSALRAIVRPCPFKVSATVHGLHFEARPLIYDESQDDTAE